ncbi:P-loop NTPase fold protein, partial [Vibrio lentus]
MRYSFNKCELNNEEYGTYLSSYLRSQKKPLVLNLNGSWGTGKTHFLKQMYSDLRFTHEYPVIYIDAWKSDFSNDPLLVLISEFIEQFKSLNMNIKATDKEEESKRSIKP